LTRSHSLGIYLVASSISQYAYSMSQSSTLAKQKAAKDRSDAIDAFLKNNSDLSSGYNTIVLLGMSILQLIEFVYQGSF
jgi:hypothetical protein